MKRPTLYSSSDRSRAAARTDRAPAAESPPAAAADSAGNPAPRRARIRNFLGRHARPLLVAAGAAVALARVSLHATLKPAPHVYTQEDIDAAVLHTL